MESEKNCLTLEQCSQEFLLYIKSVKSVSENTVIAYQDDLNHLMLCLGKEKAIREINVNDIRNCMLSLSKRKYAVASVNRFLSGVKGLFIYCKRMNYIDFNFTKEIHQLKKVKRLPSFMSPDEIDALCSEPSKKNLLWAARDRAIFEMFYSSGCRVSELTALKFSDFYNGLQSAFVLGKGNKKRAVFFSPDAQKALKVYLLERKKRFPSKWQGGGEFEDRLFLSQRGNPLSVNGVTYIVTVYSGEKGVNKHVTPHSFRHTFATQMINNGADIRRVQAMLGHSSVSTTQCYTHVTKDRLKEIYNQAFPHS